MKLLVAIKSEGKAKEVADKSLRLVGRTGYDYRLFVPPEEEAEYQEAVADANYHWYLAIPESSIDTEHTPYQFAKGKYDLLVRVPDDILLTAKDFDKEVAKFCVRVGKARIKFGAHPKKKMERMANGVIMERL